MNLVLHSESGEKLGSLALLPMPVDEDDTDYSLVVPGQMPACDVEIGYFLKPSAWGKGFATEAGGRIRQYNAQEKPDIDVGRSTSSVLQFLHSITRTNGL